MLSSSYKRWKILCIFTLILHENSINLCKRCIHTTLMWELPPWSLSTDVLTWSELWLQMKGRWRKSNKTELRRLCWKEWDKPPKGEQSLEKLLKLLLLLHSASRSSSWTSAQQFLCMFVQTNIHLKPCQEADDPRRSPCLALTWLKLWCHLQIRLPVQPFSSLLDCCAAELRHIRRLRVSLW